MELKSKHITVRLTQSQFRSLADAIINDEMSKSEKLRELIQDYLKSEGKQKQSKFK